MSGERTELDVFSSVIVFRPVSLLTRKQFFYLPLLSHFKEIIQIMLIDMNLSLVHVVHHKPETFRFHSAEVEKRVGVRVSLEN